MTWSEDCQREIDRVLDTQDVAEAITSAVGQLIQGHIDKLCIYQLGQSGGCDPKQSIDYAERLLVAAIDHLKKVR